MNQQLADSAPYGHVAVIGAGAWGTALALVAARAGRRVTLWAREAEVADLVRTCRENRLFLPGIRLPEAVAVTNSLREAAEAEALFVTAPAQHTRSLLEALGPAPGATLVLCAKGIERGSGALLTEVLAQSAPECEAGMLSGPSFAAEVARELPTAVTIAAREDVAFRIVVTLGQATFRPYASTDLVGVALGGAAKNVYAIGCGIVDGMAKGENARAALLTRSFAELCRLGRALGAKPETLNGLSGLGDLVLTATSRSSRNYGFGVRVGEGRPLPELLAAARPLAEGIETAEALVARARRHAIELPIAEAVANILSGALKLDAALPHLMSRPYKTE